MQIRVKQRFTQLREMDTQVPWHVVNAAQTVEEVQADIFTIVQATLQQCGPAANIRSKRVKHHNKKRHRQGGMLGSI
jgi:hypothetical protein